MHQAIQVTVVTRNTRLNTSAKVRLDFAQYASAELKEQLAKLCRKLGHIGREKERKAFCCVLKIFCFAHELSAVTPPFSSENNSS